MGFYIEMISVGEGDSFLLTLDSANDQEGHILIDGGDGERADRIISHVKSYAGAHLDLVIGTHLDDDHIGGLIPVIEDEQINVDKLILNTPGNFQRWQQFRTVLKSFAKVAPLEKIEKSLESATTLLEAAKKKKVPVELALAGRPPWTCGDVRLVVLNPTKDRLEAAWAEKIIEDITDISKSAGEKYLIEKGTIVPPTSLSNDSSIIIELIYKGSFYALFTGDAGATVIKEVTNKKSYQFLKVPHHGSKTGLDEDLVKQLKPSTAYIPVGDNPHGHPNIETLDLLKRYGAATYCSEKTKDCRKECKNHDSRVLCHREDKPSREGWSSVDPKDCKNNPQ
jgi:beta-lactamase superfamily II metal-dependent hydrolase